MIENKDAFLDRLANRLGRPRRTEGVERPKWSTTPQQHVHKDLSQDELIEVMKNRCANIHTDFKRTTPKELPNTLREVLDNYETKSIITSQDERFGVYGLTDIFQELTEENVEFLQWDPAKGNENIKFAERADVGITFSDITLAESATVTLFNNKNHGRTISLLPESYIAIIPRSTIVPRLTQAAEQIHEANVAGKRPTSCVSFVSGPSNSADIEMNLIVGVHGPVRATYIVVDD